MILAAVLTVAAVAAALWFATPVLIPLGKLNLLVFFVGGVSLMVFAGVPIAFCFGLSTVAYLLVTTHLPLTIVIGRMDGGMSQLILLAVPLFVFLGALLEMTGMADAMVRFLSSLLGHVRGGLSYVLVGAMYLISGVSGAKAADMAAVAPVLFPEMQRRGARGGDLVALLAATGAQTETVPPSLVLITIGSVTGVSIGALFTAGLLPSALLAAVLCTMVWWRHRDGDAPAMQRANRLGGGAPARHCHAGARTAFRRPLRRDRRNRHRNGSFGRSASLIASSSGRSPIVAFSYAGSTPPWWIRRRCRAPSC